MTFKRIISVPIRSVLLLACRSRDNALYSYFLLFLNLARVCLPRVFLCHHIITSRSRNHEEIREFAHFPTLNSGQTLVVLIVHVILILQPRVSILGLLPIDSRQEERVLTERHFCCVKTLSCPPKHGDVRIRGGHLTNYCQVLFRDKVRMLVLSLVKGW